MSLFWKKEVNKHQKIITITILVIILGLVFTAVTHNFVPVSEITTWSAYISAFLTTVFFAYIFYVRRKGFWRIKKPKLSKFTRIILAPFYPVFMFFFLWLSIVTPLPYLYTALFGESSQITLIAEKDENTGRHSYLSCRYRIDPKTESMAYAFQCISKNLYERLPEGDLEVLMDIKKSSLGFVIQDIRPTSNVRS